MTKARDLANASTALSAVSATELGYVDGVTSAIQTQIDAKIGSASAINPTIVDAKGDIIAATAADTVARLAVGANGTVLTAASGEATGLQWATPSSGGMTLLSTTTLSGASTTISSIDQTYNKLEVIIFGVTNATADGNFRFEPNAQNSLTGNSMRFGDTLSRQDDNRCALTDFANTFSPRRVNNVNCWNITFVNYSSTTQIKNISIFGAFKYGGASPGQAYFTNDAQFNSTSAITSLVFSNNGGNFDSGTVLIYGVK